MIDAAWDKGVSSNLDLPASGAESVRPPSVPRPTPRRFFWGWAVGARSSAASLSPVPRGPPRERPPLKKSGKSPAYHGTAMLQDMSKARGGADGPQLPGIITSETRWSVLCLGLSSRADYCTCLPGNKAARYRS